MDINKDEIKCSECTDKICEECVKLKEARDIKKGSNKAAIFGGLIAYYAIIGIIFLVIRQR